MRKSESTVMLITGPTGVGKSTLLDRFVVKQKGSVQLFRPENLSGDLFDVSAVDWENHAAVIIDEVGNWDRASIRTAIHALEEASYLTDKKLILVCMFPQDMDDYDIGLARTHMVFEVKKNSNLASLPFSFDGAQVHFKDDLCAERFSTGREAKVAS